MSTETPAKQVKGAKGNAEEKKSKKRRREEQQDASAKTAVEGESTPAKKQKKEKRDRKVDGKTEVAEDATGAGAESTAPKKEKKKRRKSNDAPVEEAPVEATKPAVSASPNATAVETVKPAQDSASPEATRKSKKKKNKDRRASVQETNGTADEPRPSPSAITDPQPTTTAATQIAIDEKQLETESPFVQVTASFYLALSPIAHHFPLEGLCAEHISPMLLTYHPPLKGVVLSYSNPRMSEEPESAAKAYSSKEAKVVLGRSIDEYAVTYVWLTADFLVFKPQRDTVLEGHVNLQNESILGLICYNYFNAGIERSRIPKDWQWVEDESAEGDAGMSRKGRRNAAGHYVDASGKKVEGRLVFRVKDFEATAGAENGSGSINIYGTLLGEREDAKVDEDERQKTLVRDRPRRT